jgi:hypothetical protein
MRRLAGPVVVLVAAMVLVATASMVQSARAQEAGPAPGGGVGVQGRGATPPVEAQPGHPSGQLVIWGDSALFDGRLNPENCILLSRFKRGMRMGFRMTAIDGGTGETENTATLTGHLTYTSRTKGKLTIDFPMRWRGAERRASWAPGYLRPPVELWTGFWIVPEDAETGMIVYTITGLDRFGRKASFRPFPDIGSQIYIVD